MILNSSEKIITSVLFQERRQDDHIVNPSKDSFGRPHSTTNVNYTKYLPVNTQDDINMRVALSQPILIPKAGMHMEVPTSRSFGSGIMKRKDVFYQGSLENVSYRRS